MNQYISRAREYLKQANFGLHTLLAALASGFMLAITLSLDDYIITNFTNSTTFSSNN